MADTVRFLMEEMVPALEDLQARGYFSRDELQKVVKKRENFEYQLKRKAALKTDFLRYLEYEMKLEELRVARKQALGANKGRPSLADHAGVRHIHYIFERALRKFKGDLALWMRWLDFCKASNSPRMMSKVLTRALQLHPGVPGLWAHAAAWELDRNANAAAARSLMQRGLRMCPDAQSLWLEYFRMELLYAHRLRQRRAVLGIGGGKGTAAAAGRAGDSAQEPEGDTAVEAADGASPPAPEPEEAGDDSASDAASAVLRGAVAMVVWRSAAQAFPQSLELRRKALEMLRKFDFPGVEAIEDEVYSGLEADFRTDAEAWDMRARRCLSGRAEAASGDSDARQAAAQVYDAGLAAAPSPRLFELYAAFLTERLEALLGAGAGEAERREGAAAAQELLTLYRRAEAEGHASEALLTEWSRLALRCGRPKEALRVARDACRARPACAGLWLHRLDLTAQQASRGGASTDELRQVALDAVDAAPGHAGAPMWRRSIEVLSGDPAGLAQLLERLETACMGLPRGPLQGGLGEVAAQAVRAVDASAGLEAARAFYRRLMRLPPPGADFFRGVIAFELEQEPGEQLSPQLAKRVRELFEAAADAYGKVSAELWLNYCKFQQQQGGAAGDVYWRATKALDDPEPFRLAASATHDVQRM